jgi:hypothetical protein
MENIEIDRMACAWLILRRIDAVAEFAFVPVGEAIPDGHEPFDILGVRLSHRRGHCSFHLGSVPPQLQAASFTGR